MFSTNTKKGYLPIVFVLLILVSLSFLFYINKNDKYNENDINKNLKIAAFNIQIFGESKMSKENVVAILLDILSRYDIVLIEEIRDKKGEAIIKLLHRLNTMNGNKYSLVLSKRLGNTSSKEQYAFIYNKNKLKVLKTYLYNDLNNSFEREPFSVKFAYLNYDFVLIGVHVDPDKVYSELSLLDDVIKNDISIFSDKDIILMGDMNADCSYISNKKLLSLDLYKSFNWFINSSVDTTVSKTDCAYDRIISTDSIKNNISDAKVFYFDKFNNLSYKKAKKVSDHYPIEFVLSFGKSTIICRLFIKK